MRALAVALLLTSTACGLQSAKPPAGLVCDSFTVIGEGLSEALTAARPNECVILLSGTYAGAFELPSDVSLAAANGAMVMLTGDGSGKPVLTVRGGLRSTVRGLKIDSSRGDGVAIDPGPVNLIGVTVQGDTSRSALTSTCTKGTCEQVTLEDTELVKCSTGLLVAGGVVRMVRGRVAEMGGSGLSDGSGVVASRGARVTLESVTVEGNKQAGVLVDGEATALTLDQTHVRANLERGVWVQNAPDGGVQIMGGTISENRLVGLGVRDSSGLTLTSVEISATQLVEVPVGVGAKENVGDGVGLFEGARDIVLDLVRTTGNGRAQILADGSGAGVRVNPSEVSGGQFRVVVQRGATALEVPPALIDTPGRELATKSAAVPVSQ
ncbi:MAG: right-handed parallel beta-helix repeat-containing protein [Myxococcaceae bacterium]|nr:right-handed parallel beta-helix repeat-containing protein [Myxococcaceae bacterium]